MHGINCQGCEFLRHEPPVESGVPGQMHLFRCMNPDAGFLRGHIVKAVKPKFYYDEMPVHPWPGFCKK